jgi:aldose 1-epimerase
MALLNSRVALMAALTLSCAFLGQAKGTVTKKEFGKLKNGTAVELYTLKNGKIEASITNFGATVVSLLVPDKSGKVADVVLGYDNPADYEAGKSYFGAVVGRYGNRISKGRFHLDGHEYKLATNDGPNHLHGGTIGFNKKVWTAHVVGDALQLTYVSPDGEEGYPGKLTATVTYSLVGSGLRIDYKATSDKDTVANLTNHSYYNLAASGDILNHELTIHADRFTPVDSTLIPTGALQKVEGTPFDFRTPHRIGDRIGKKDEQLKFGKGYDQNWVLNRTGAGLSMAARVSDPVSGRVMEVYTTQPGLQFYTGNFLDGTAKGKGGKVYQFRSALCMETQHYPDSPNHAAFPTTELKAGQTFTSTTEFRFSVQ